MKKMKKVLAVALSVIMVTAALTGCAKSKDEKTNATPTATTAPKEDDKKGTENAEPTKEADVDLSKHVTLKWFLHGSDVTDDKAVLEKANEYLKEKLNVTLEPIWGTWGDFNDRSTLAINAGDNIDIYFTCSWSANEYNQFAKKGAWVRLDDGNNNLIEKYGKDIFGILPEVLVTGAKINGTDGYGIYAVPGYKDIATQNCWDVNVTLLEKYGYTLDDIKNTDYYGFEDILATVKAGEGADFYPLLVEGAVLERMVTNSIIVTGDSGTANVLSSYINPTDTAADGPYGTQIFNKFATPEYKKFVEKTREYYLAGYINPGLANSDQANDLRTQKQNAGQYLIGTQSYSLGYEEQVSVTRGIKVGMVPVTPAYVDTTSSQGAMMAISTASKNPERAMMFLNLLNTDPYLMTLLDYGIEGVHYNIVNGEAVFNVDERASYIPWTNGMGNITLLPPQKGLGANFWDTFKDYYSAAGEIPLLGWAFDAKNKDNDVEVELNACANAAAEFALALSVGSIDPATELPKFLDKLEANGIQKVVDAANKSVQDYLAAKGK